MHSFQEYLQENLGNLQGLPPAVVNKLAKWNSMIGQNSTVIDFTSRATAENLNREVNNLRKEEGDDEYLKVYIIFNDFETRYDFDKRDNVKVPITVVLSKDTSRASTYDHDTYITQTGDYYSLGGYKRGNKRDTVKLTDFNFAEITKHSKVWILFNDKNRVKLRGERSNAKFVNDPLAQSSMYSKDNSSSVNADYAVILFNRKLQEVETALQNYLSKIKFSVADTTGRPQFTTTALEGVYSRLKTAALYGISFPYARDGRIAMKEFKEQLDRLNKIKDTFS